MKKILLFVLILFVANGLVSAQEGKLFLTGNLTYWSTKNETKWGTSTSTDNKTTDFGLGGKLGYKVNENVALGLGLGYSSYETEDDDNYINNNYYTTNTTSMLTIAPFVRFYLFNEAQFHFFLEAELSYGTGKYETNNVYRNTTVTTSQDLTNLTIGISPNIQYFLTKRLAIESGFGFFGYEQNKTKQDSYEHTTSSFGLKLLPRTLNFGVSFFF